MVKTSFKQKVIYAVFNGITYAILMGIFDLISTGEISIYKFLFHAFSFGILMGFVIPFITERYSKKQIDKIQIGINEDENIKLESQANTNGTIGKIILTNKRLLFKEKGSPAFNFIEVQNETIKEVKTKSTLGLINNKFIVSTESKNYEFVVYENERNLWVSALQNSLNQSI